MITVTKEVKINPGLGDTGPYEYVWNVSSPDSSCVSLSNPTGTIQDPDTQTIINTFTFFNETCLNDTTVTLSVTYNNGKCTATIPVSISNPCESFTVNQINHFIPYTFTVSVNGGEGPYNYYWIYDNTVFNNVSSNPNSNTLTLEPMSGNPQEYIVGVRVVDKNGCEAFLQKQIINCTPQAPNYNVMLQCVPNGGSVGNVCIDLNECPGAPIDWSTFTMTSHLQGFTVTDLGTNCGNGGRLFRIEANSSVQGGLSYILTYKVYDVYGNESNEGSLYTSVPLCSNTQSIVILNHDPIQIDCSYSPGDTYYIGPIDNYIVSADPVDYTSFQFIDILTNVPTPGPYTTPNGGVVTFNQTTHMIEYVIPAGASTDMFKWTICTTNGDCAESTIIALLLICAQPPVAVDDTMCGNCGIEEEHNVLANDTINGTLTNLSIVTAPNRGIAVFNGNYANPRILYTADPGFSGTDSYQYQITNDAGETAIATVTVNVQCAGNDTNISICE